jgi:hypothetical protein
MCRTEQADEAPVFNIDQTRSGGSVIVDRTVGPRLAGTNWRSPGDRVLVSFCTTATGCDRSRADGDCLEDIMTVSAFDTPEQLITYASAGGVSKQALASLLTAQARRPFLAACAAIELKYTESCREQNDPCLETGCSMDGEEQCLEPLLLAGTDYGKACGGEWAKLFIDVANRDPSWRVTVSISDLT